MKAYLLAAGLGTRLRPLTDHTPKCLVPVGNRPLLGWWFELFMRHKVTDVLINTHYLADQVEDYVRNWQKEHTGLRIVTAFEEELLGSGGTVSKNRRFTKDGEDFLICYADNLTDADLTALMNRHRKNRALLTMGLFHTNVPTQCGIAELDTAGRIIAFEEKPERPKSDLANAGIYAAGTELFNYLPETGFCDFGKDVLPKLTGMMYGEEINGYLRDIGTPENLELAREEWTYAHL